MRVDRPSDANRTTCGTQPRPTRVLGAAGAVMAGGPQATGGRSAGLQERFEFEP